MDHELPDQALDASFDIVARQDAADQMLGALRSDVEEVKGRLDRAARQARPALDGSAPVSPVPWRRPTFGSTPVVGTD